MEKFKASQAALEIKNDDHVGHRKVEIIGKKIDGFYNESFLSFYLVKLHSLFRLTIKARRVEKFKASQAALEIKNKDYARHGKVEIIGKKLMCFELV